MKQLRNKSLKHFLRQSGSPAVEKYKEAGYLACALGVATDAVPYHTVEYPNKVCLIVGNEFRDISRRTFDVCDMAIYLPMYGKVGS